MFTGFEGECGRVRDRSRAVAYGRVRSGSILLRSSDQGPWLVPFRETRFSDEPRGLLFAFSLLVRIIIPLVRQ